MRRVEQGGVPPGAPPAVAGDGLLDKVRVVPFHPAPEAHLVE